MSQATNGQLESAGRRRTYVGVAGPWGCVVRAVNGDPSAVGRAIRLRSGARLLINRDGAWRYDPEAALDHLRGGESAIDGFHFDFQHGASCRRESVTVSLGAAACPAPVVIGPCGDGRGRDPLRMLVRGSSYVPLRFDVRGHLKPPAGPSAAVVLLEDSPHGEAEVAEDGSIRFQPLGGFTGTAVLHCLCENRHRTATLIEVSIEVSAPVRFHNSRTPDRKPRSDRGS